jgi:hypothetical protein
MRIRLSHALAVLGLVLGLAAGLAAQVRMPEDSEDVRLFPKSANTDGTLNCFPKCGRFENCC